MRLISKFHDYYDGAIRTSVSDKSFTFVREQREIRGPAIQVLDFDIRSPNWDYFFDGGAICFCGTIYPFIRVHERPGPYLSGKEDPKTIFFYDFDEFRKEYPKLGDSKRVKTWRWWKSGPQCLTEARRWLPNGEVKLWSTSYSLTKDSKVRDIFLSERVAYFSVNPQGYMGKDYRITIYPSLQEIQFYKMFDSYTVFQKIEMFLTNEIVKPDDPYIEPVPDKVKAESHGYDKWSFRKIKGD